METSDTKTIVVKGEVIVTDMRGEREAHHFVKDHIG